LGRYAQKDGFKGCNGTQKMIIIKQWFTEQTKSVFK